MATVDTYINLLPTQHRAQPNFSAMVAGTCRPFVDGINVLEALVPALDIDVAVGDQLDILGQWIGVSRYLTVPISAYFSFDVIGFGWDEGVWKLPTDSSAGTLTLPDFHYRAVLKARILNNHWDGSVSGAYAIMNAMFSNFGYFIGIKDNGDLTMELVLVGPIPPDVLLWSLFTSGLLDVRPIGIEVINRTYTASMDKLDSTFILDQSVVI